MIRHCNHFILTLTLKFSKRQKSPCGRAAGETVEPERSSSVSSNSLFHFRGQRTKPSRQRNNVVCQWKTPERQLQDSIRVIYGINFEMFLTSYISVPCQVWHSDISALHKRIHLCQTRNALIVFTSVYVWSYSWIYTVQTHLAVIYIHLQILTSS